VIQLICLFAMTASLYATTFKPQPIEQQVRESDGLFQGNFLKSKTVELENGSLATQMIFKMTKEVGLQSDFFGMDEVIVHYPGGRLNDKYLKVEGVPQFVPGEKVVLFIRNVDNRYWGMNLGFGSFRVINYGKEVVLVNYVFPHDQKFGQITMQRFEQVVKTIKGSGLKVVQSVHYPTSPEKDNVQRLPASISEGQNRALASKTEQLDNQHDQPKLNVFWLIIALGLTGGLFRMSARKTHK
jgi:hypothetical protein